MFIHHILMKRKIDVHYINGIYPLSGHTVNEEYICAELGKNQPLRLRNNVNVPVATSVREVSGFRRNSSILSILLSPKIAVP